MRFKHFSHISLSLYYHSNACNFRGTMMWLKCMKTCLFYALVECVYFCFLCLSERLLCVPNVVDCGKGLLQMCFFITQFILHNLFNRQSMETFSFSLLKWDLVILIAIKDDLCDEIEKFCHVTSKRKTILIFNQVMTKLNSWGNISQHLSIAGNKENEDFPLTAPKR
jgi:hypothetical protein